MQVVVLCGGQGTRLREETEFRPKPLVEIGGHPILWHIMKIYAHHGVKDFILCLGYRANMIKEYFLNYEAMNNDFTISLGSNRQLVFHGNHSEQDYSVTLAETGLGTMTGGRVRRIERFVEGDTFMVTYGDGVGDVDIARLLDFHREHGRLATVTTVKPASRYAVLDIDSSQCVVQFDEKPQLDSSISAGYFVFNRRVFDYLDGDSTILEREPLERLASEGQLMAFRHDGLWMAMDTYRDFLQLNEIWDSGAAPWKVWE